MAAAHEGLDERGQGQDWFLRGGLFAKYVVSLVGLVVFVLAVNGAMETWISYRATKSHADRRAWREKAEATARRIEQSMSELERQISWVTRASADHACEQRRADYAQLLNQVPAVSQLSFSTARAASCCGCRARSVATDGDADFSRDVALHRNRRPRRQLRAGLFRGDAALHVDRGGAFRLQRRRHRGRDRPALPRPTSSATPRSARRRSPMWSIRAARCWRRPRRGPRSARICRRCRRSPP